MGPGNLASAQDGSASNEGLDMEVQPIDQPGLEDLQLYVTPLYAVGLPTMLPPDIAKTILATCLSWPAQMSARSVERRYFRDWRAPKVDRHILIARDAVSQAKREVSAVLRYITPAAKKTTEPSAFAAWAALCRLQATFKACGALLLNGYHFEATALQRMLIEQLAWVYAIHDVREDEQDFFHIRPSRSITRLKEMFPEVGEVYGRLSSSSHLEPRETLKYIRADYTATAWITIKSPDYASLDGLTLLTLADMFGVIGERAFMAGPGIGRFVTWIGGSEVVPNSRRPLRARIRAMERRVRRARIRNNGQE